jgi:hypothetical protein
MLLVVAHSLGFARTETPTITAVTPASVPLTGGSLVTITGRNLGAGTDITAVTLAGVAATVQPGQTATSVVVAAGPSSVATTGNVVVMSTTRGTTTMTGGFTYFARASLFL